MLGHFISRYGIYGDEEEDFKCDELFETAFEKINDTEIDIEIITKYLLEKTDFIDWIEQTYHSLEENNTYNDDLEYEPDEYEQISMFNAQAEILKETQEELKALKKKYNKLLRKYKGIKGSL